MMGFGDGYVHHKVRRALEQSGFYVLLDSNVGKAGRLDALGYSVSGEVNPANQGSVGVVDDGARPRPAHPARSDEHGPQLPHRAG